MGTEVRSRSGACENKVKMSQTRSARGVSRDERGRKASEATPCTPGGGLSGRGQDAPAKNRFKGLRGFKRGLRGKSKSPCPLLPSPGRRPARRRLVLTKLVIIAFLSEGERTSGGARGTRGDCDLPPKVPLDSHYPLQTPTLGGILPPGVVPSPWGARICGCAKQLSSL